MLRLSRLLRPLKIFRPVLSARYVQTDAVDYYNVKVPQNQIQQMTQLLDYYDYRYDINIGDKITRVTKNRTTTYSTLEQFLLKEIFYKNRKNLHFHKLPNKANQLANFDIGPLYIVKKYPLLTPLLSHNVFNRYLNLVHNYGTFIRFAINKVQRLYWMPNVNAGIPLSAKDKDPVYELVFMLHDFGHFLLPDLMFTGKLTDSNAKLTYINWRLLSESITVVLNEMLVVDYLKDTPEFKRQLTLGYDKPYKLFQILKPIKDKESLKALFWASYCYFCQLNDGPFMNLIDKSHADWQTVWAEFHQRYQPVASRGREWTETNFNRLCDLKEDYQKWWLLAEPFSELNFKPIEGYLMGDDETTIMSNMFDNIWSTLLEPLFYGPDVKPITDEARKILAFKRYMIGNLMVLIKHNIDVRDMLRDLRTIKVTDFDRFLETYRSRLKILYDKQIIDFNEYHNARDMVIMIPPNILKKNAY